MFELMETFLYFRQNIRDITIKCFIIFPTTFGSLLPPPPIPQFPLPSLLDPSLTGAYEGFCLGGGAQFARVSAPKKIWPPLKNPFFEKILIPELVLFTIKIHQKDCIIGWLLTL